jgi:hypothetical protein
MPDAARVADACGSGLTIEVTASGTLPHLRDEDSVVRVDAALAPVSF